ncbi:hypothetical protein [Methylobacterium oxalidis]|uniref:Uncharacterized protein n=1 Tax=Methylobacterium oxalidis TaxID=944322 RepID=A0A512JA27_9HYPH|nr:hypothetical protein [Methylobacterium oxalidis]GEP06824.1 hypothetical protein MOX02_48620 [Methylobacterium oxalidis]GJE31092.1 hypothetical protein LDDCCGHA_1265 [Methylobacterium oxalidis]GLS62942.1 hypothetical protein GCM10007888_13230 [Methylobacterium oxalidis]
MIVVSSFLCLAAGVGLAAASLRFPDRAPALERWSGVCLVAGLALLGAGLQLRR